MSYASMDSEFRAFLTSTLYEDQWSASFSGHSNPVPTEYEADGPQSQPESSGEEKTLYTHRESNTDPSIVSIV